jgi:hypothetical protein
MALRTQIDANTVIALLPIDRSSRQKIHIETSELLHTLGQIEVVDTYRIFHPRIRQCAFFSVAHGTFFKIDYLNKFKKNLQ